MSIYDPPSDPFGNEVRCPVCDGPAKWDDWTKEWYCDDHQYVLIICSNADCEFEYDGSIKECDEDWTIACPECGCDVRVLEYDLED
jgi:hypothetical protein